MTLKAQMNRNDSTGFGDVSVALPVGTDLWLGDFDGQDIAIEPNQLSTAAQPRKEPRCRLKKHYAKLPHGTMCKAPHPPSLARSDECSISERHAYGGRKALDLAAVLKRKIRPAFDKLGIAGVGWHTFRHTVGTVLAELGEHQLTIRDYLRHSNLSVTNKYLQAASKTKRNAQARLVEAILPVHLLPAGKTAETVAPLIAPRFQKCQFATA